MEGSLSFIYVRMVDMLKVNLTWQNTLVLKPITLTTLTVQKVDISKIAKL